MAAKRESAPPDPPSTALERFSKAVRYGPNFGCIVCGGAHFLCNVTEAKEVGGLASLESQERFLHRDFLLSNYSLFQQLDTEWCCRQCRSEVDAGRLPALASRNGLAPTWVSLPAPIQSLQHLEMEMISLSHVLCTVEGLGSMVGDPSKRLYLLLGRAVSAPTLAASVREVGEILALHTRPAGHLLQLRVERVLEAWRRLLLNHPRYQLAPDVRDDAHEYLKMELLGLVGTQGLVEELGPGGPPGEQGQAAGQLPSPGPRLSVLQGTVLPWAIPYLSAAARRLLTIPALEAQLAGIIDLQEEAAVVRERERPISLQMWVEQRIRHIHRAGLASKPGLIFALLQLLDSQQLAALIARGEAGEAGSRGELLANHPGTSAYYSRLKQNLKVLREWMGSPVFFMTTTVSTTTADLLGTFVAHLAGVEGRDDQVWHKQHETERLTVRPGQQEPEGDGHGEEYFVHSASMVEQDSCPFHTFCVRTNIETWRDRWVAS
jgi:hypothetical protein